MAKLKHVQALTGHEWWRNKHQTQHTNLPFQTLKLHFAPTSPSSCKTNIPACEPCGLKGKNGKMARAGKRMHTYLLVFSGLCSHQCLSSEKEKKVGGKRLREWGYQMKQLQGLGPGFSMSSSQQLLVFNTKALQDLLERKIVVEMDRDFQQLHNREI